MVSESGWPRFLFPASRVSSHTEAAMRKHTLANLILTSVTVAILGMPCGQALAAGTSGFGVSVLVDETPRTEYYHRGAVYIEAVRGASYSLRLTNPTPYRAAAALSVDGLNTPAANHTDPRAPAN